MYSYGKYMLSFHDTELNIINFASLERSIHYWVESIAHSVLVNELTPDNSHTFLDRMEPLMMLLVHKEEERVNGIVKNNMIQVAKRLGYLVVNDTNTDKAIAEPTKTELDTGEIIGNISGRLDKLGELYEYRLLQTAPEEDREFVKSEIDSLTLYIEANFPLLKVLAKSPEELEVTLKDSLKTEDLKSKIERIDI